MIALVTSIIQKDNPKRNLYQPKSLLLNYISRQRTEARDDANFHDHAKSKSLLSKYSITGSKIQTGQIPVIGILILTISEEASLWYYANKESKFLTRVSRKKTGASNRAEWLDHAKMLKIRLKYFVKKSANNYD